MTTIKNRYRVDLDVAGRPHVRIVMSENVGLAVGRARRLVVDDGWSVEQIGKVRAENEADPHDYWESVE